MKLAEQCSCVGEAEAGQTGFGSIFLIFFNFSFFRLESLSLVSFFDYNLQNPSKAC